MILDKLLVRIRLARLEGKCSSASAHTPLRHILSVQARVFRPARLCPEPHDRCQIFLLGGVEEEEKEEEEEAEEEEKGEG